ncbi:Tetratricopeptide repeat-containing protein [Chryseobacterium arachidis]|uniref:Tetratricopeptide repeat-containing protein n=1 Tax=Chryseobacterium arachidis TaxID=1416778 RepID=A0A1M4UTM2_9FLAO|nr:tetratricopeptide repeat protein [Chryseobacterium arachidis]SHE60086.1 Tetratricopeptide repeat-containing protein [Chryseobacterium arachidis]
MIKKLITTLIPIFICSLYFGQKKKDGFDKGKLIQELADGACKCSDSIHLLNRSKSDILKDIQSCIDKQTGALQMGTLLGSAETLEKDAPVVNGKKQINLTFNTDKNSKQYIDSYNELERYLMKNCESVKNIAIVSETKDEGFSNDKEAMEFYHNGRLAAEKEDWKEAIKNMEKAVKKDPKFIYAWDALGINYRRSGEYDKAISAYKKSLELDSKGKMALQNIPIVYIYKKEFQKAIDAYMDLDKVYPEDPEVYYGIGNVYFNALKDDEKGLDYICKAYRIYTNQKSPYRTDAESLIGAIYKSMKEKGKTEKFKEILKNNNIQFD